MNPAATSGAGALGRGTRGRRRLLLAGLVTLAAGLGGELAELPSLVHLLCLTGIVAALAILAYVVPRIAVDDPPGAERGPRM